MGHPTVCCIQGLGLSHHPSSSSFEQREDKQHPIQQMILITEITVPQAENELKNFDNLLQNHIGLCQMLCTIKYLQIL